MIYRGILWVHADGNADKVTACVRNSPEFREPIWRVGRWEGTDVKSVAASQWRLVKKIVNNQRDPAFPMDDVPWEIHWIEDEVAYETALAAYWASNVVDHCG